jgi:hypothetical protein
MDREPKLVINDEDSDNEEAGILSPFSPIIRRLFFDSDSNMDSN